MAARNLAGLLGVLATSLSLGCAPAYHGYSQCHVPCRYCPPPPLPLCHYPGCACHSCAVSEYLSPTAAERTHSWPQE